MIQSSLGPLRVVQRLLLAMCLALAAALPAMAQADLLISIDEPYPLRAADTSSPRDTLRTFLRDFSTGVDAWRTGKPSEEIRRPLLRAAETMDFSALPALGRESAILIDMALLREILDRVELPQFENIPGDAEVARDGNLTRWVIPNTKVEIVRIDEGPNAGEFLFSKETVAQLRNYYELAREIPYRSGAIVGIYDEVLSSPGQWLPLHFPDRLPDWSRTIVAGQGLWQWLALAALVVVCAPLFTLLLRAGRHWDHRNRHRSAWLRFGTPLALLLVVGLTGVAYNLIENAIGIFELPLDVIGYVALGIQAVGLSWLVFVLSGRLADGIASVGGGSEGRRHFDAALTRILFRLCSLVVVILLAIGTAEAVGIPIAPLVAGLGVGGLAIALAVRPTLENVIGGLTLFADRPVRVGDFCRYGSDVGTVEQIGLRSTRIRTLEQSLVTVPNSEFSQLHLDNFTARRTRLLKTVLQLRYETTPDQMRLLLTRLRELLIAHPMVTPDPARVRFVGYGAFSKDVEIFTYIRCADQDTFLAVQEDLLLRIEEVIQQAGSGFAFPSSTTYLARDAGLDGDKTEKAEAMVARWRDENRLPFPDVEASLKAELADSLDYPPKGSHDFHPPGAASTTPAEAMEAASSRRTWNFGLGRGRKAPKPT